MRNPWTNDSDQRPHATFKFLFNGIYYGGATPVNLGTPARKTTN